MLYFSLIFFAEFGILFSLSATDWEHRLVLEAFKSNPNTSMAMAVLPLRFTFCKLASVAKGTTKGMLLQALGYKNVEEVKTCFNKIQKDNSLGNTPALEKLDLLQMRDLILLNKLYVNYSSEVDMKFLVNSSKQYGVDVQSIGFNLPRTALLFINNEIARLTYNRVRDVVETYDIAKDTQMMMIVAAHLRASWEYPFKIKRTIDRKFYRVDGKTVFIPMMVQHESYLYFENRHYKVLRKTLESPDISFSIVVPSKALGIEGLLDMMRGNPNILKETRDSSKIVLRKLVLPRFRIKNTLDLTEVMKKMNDSVGEVFNRNSSGLNGILKEEFRNQGNMFVSKVKQKLFLEIDEFGAARHPMRPTYDIENNYPDIDKAQMRMLEFAADRPFFFTIDLEDNISTYYTTRILVRHLFCGVYYGPE